MNFGGKNKISKLEALRGLAAAYVLFSHLFTQRVLEKTSIAGFPFRFGQEAVMVFFIISGFVIYLSIVTSNQNSFFEYFVKRFRRIYPIFLLALVVSVLTCSADEPTLNISTAIGNLFMLQDFEYGKPGVWFSPLGGNSSLWSLSYEWWFYMMFYPLYKFIPPPIQLNAVGVISTIGLLSYSIFPNQISLFLMSFILWWSGVEVAKLYVDKQEISFRVLRPLLVWLGTIALLQSVSVFVSIVKRQPISFGMHPILEVRFTLDCLALISLGVLWRKRQWKFFGGTIGRFSSLSSISYALYVLHWPLAIAPTYLDKIGNKWIEILCYITITLSVAWVAEGPFQRWINRHIGYSSNRAAVGLLNKTNN